MHKKIVLNYIIKKQWEYVSGLASIDVYKVSRSSESEFGASVSSTILAWASEKSPFGS